MSIPKLISILALCVTQAFSQSLPCENNMNCRDCITDNNVCVWCAADDHKHASRCVLQSKATDDWCSKVFLQRPNATVEAVASPEDSHVLPQIYKLNLLPGEAANFTFTLNTSAINYPVDVYFLLDARAKHRYNQINKIIETLKEMTQDISLGLGTFVNKDVPDFCYSRKCYSFKHNLTLTSNYTEFQQMLDIISNPDGKYSDSPSSGSEALTQAIACKQIGWRDESAKIVVFESNTPIHEAGDGKRAGIRQPYDGKCYTDADGRYTKDSQMDYPSLHMINKLAIENDITIVFIYCHEWTYTYAYDNLPQRLGVSELLHYYDMYDGVFASKIRSIYERSGKRVNPRIQYKGTAARNFKITFDPDCTKIKDKDACKIVKDGTHNVTASVTLLQYEGLHNYSLHVAVPGMSEQLTLDIEVTNECGCESTVDNNTEDCGGDARQLGMRHSQEQPTHLHVLYQIIVYIFRPFV